MKIAITVTGSVAESVAPSCNAIGSDNADSDSSPILVHNHTNSLQLEHMGLEGRIPDDDGRDESPSECKCENTPNISKEIRLMSITLFQ